MIGFANLPAKLESWKIEKQNLFCTFFHPDFGRISTLNSLKPFRLSVDGKYLLKQAELRDGALQPSTLHHLESGKTFQIGTVYRYDNSAFFTKAGLYIADEDKLEKSETRRPRFFDSTNRLITSSEPSPIGEVQLFRDDKLLPEDARFVAYSDHEMSRPRCIFVNSEAEAKKPEFEDDAASKNFAAYGESIVTATDSFLTHLVHLPVLRSEVDWASFHTYLSENYLTGLIFPDLRPSPEASCSSEALAPLSSSQIRSMTFDIDEPLTSELVSKLSKAFETTFQLVRSPSGNVHARMELVKTTGAFFSEAEYFQKFLEILGKLIQLEVYSVDFVSASPKSALFLPEQPIFKKGFRKAEHIASEFKSSF